MHPLLAESRRFQLDRTIGAATEPKKNDYGEEILPFSFLTNFEFEIEQKEISEGEFEFFTNSEIPDSILNKQGQPIEISGFMLPIELDDDGKITLFLLLANLQTCCFGDNIDYNEWIVVTVPDGTDVFDLERLITIRGALEVRADFEGGVFNGLYHCTTNHVFIQ